MAANVLVTAFSCIRGSETSTTYKQLLLKEGGCTQQVQHLGKMVVFQIGILYDHMTCQGE